MSRLIKTFCAAAFVSFLTISPGLANNHSWVASFGNDANDCSRGTPCATIGGAVSKTVAGGEITCADSGNFTPTSITQSITINCEGVVANNSLDTIFVNVFSINVTATDVVTIRGFDIDLNSRTLASGISFTGAGTLILDRVKISNASVISGLSGVSFTPSGVGKLIVTDSIFVNNGMAPSGAGILVKPSSGGTAQATLERVNVSANLFGVAADGTASTGGINMTVKDSVLASNINDGLVAATSSGGAPIGVLVSNTASTNNGFGIRSIGPNVTVRVDSCKIAGNGTGLSSSSGGALLSAGNNIVQANGTNGSFTGSVPLD